MKLSFLSVLAALPFFATPAFAGGINPSSCSAAGQGYSLSQVRSKLGTNGQLSSTVSVGGLVSTGYSFNGNGTCIVSFQNKQSVMSMYMKF
jgi:hypothetical protein